MRRKASTTFGSFRMETRVASVFSHKVGIVLRAKTGYESMRSNNGSQFSQEAYSISKI